MYETISTTLDFEVDAYFSLSKDGNINGELAMEQENKSTKFTVSITDLLDQEIGYNTINHKRIKQETKEELIKILLLFYFNINNHFYHCRQCNIYHY